MFHVPRKKKRVRPKKQQSDLTSVQSIFEELRQIQWETNCSTMTLQKFLNALRGRLGRLVKESDELPGSIKHADKLMQSMVRLIFCVFLLVLVEMMNFDTQAGEKHQVLHGCVGCNNKVWGPDDDSDVCELCNGHRYDDKGKAKEFVVHFPLKERLEKLLKCHQYYMFVRWEGERRTNDDYVTGK